MSGLRSTLWIGFAAALVTGSNAAVGQAYPYKPIRIVTGLPGGGSDVVTRLLANGMSTSMGHSVIVDNRPGGIIPREIVRKAPADGYTLLVIGNALWLQQFMEDDVQIDPVRDFLPVSLVTNAPNVLVVHPSVQANSVKELIALAKAKPGVLNYSSAATGSSSHLAGELFKSMAGVSIVRIPYKGNVPAVTDLMAGQVQLSFATPASVMPHAKSGKLRALAVTSLQPYPAFPELPTVASAGLPGYESGTLTALVAPAKTPATIIARLHQEVARVLNRPEIKDRLAETGAIVVASSPQELAAKMKSEMSRLGKVLKEAGVRSE